MPKVCFHQIWISVNVAMLAWFTSLHLNVIMHIWIGPKEEAVRDVVAGKYAQIEQQILKYQKVWQSFTFPEIFEDQTALYLLFIVFSLIWLIIKVVGHCQFVLSSTTSCVLLTGSLWEHVQWTFRAEGRNQNENDEGQD